MNIFIKSVLIKAATPFSPLLKKFPNIIWKIRYCKDYKKFPNLKNIWLGLDIFNLFDIKNTSSYYWITNIDNHQYAIPNYLTGRQLNIRLIVDF